MSVKPRAINELAELFSRIHQLPRLQTINLSFYPSHENWLRVNIQTSILGALVADFSIRTLQNLISLSLHNLRPLYLRPSSLPHFKPYCIPYGASNCPFACQNAWTTHAGSTFGAPSAHTRSSHQRSTPLGSLLCTPTYLLAHYLACPSTHCTFRIYVRSPCACSSSSLPWASSLSSSSMPPPSRSLSSSRAYCPSTLTPRR